MENRAPDRLVADQGLASHPHSRSRQGASHSRLECTAFGTGTEGRVMRVIEHERKVAVINALCNGMSLRATARVLNTHRTAIQDLLVRVGENCERLMGEHMRELSCRNIEIDEIWTFCGKKQGR